MLRKHERERIKAEELLACEQIESEELLERERIKIEELLAREQIEVENTGRHSLSTAEQTIQNAMLDAESQIQNAFARITNLLDENMKNLVNFKPKFRKHIENITNAAIDKSRKMCKLEITKLKNIKNEDAEFLNGLAQSTANHLKQEVMLKVDSLAKLNQIELESLREQSKDPSFNTLDYVIKICELRKKNAIIESDKLKHAALDRYNLLRDNAGVLCNQLKSDANLSVTHIILDAKDCVNEINTELELFQAEKLHEIKHLHSHTKKYLVIIAMMVTISGTSMFYLNTQINLKDNSESFATSYLVQNLRGDTVDTWMSWKKPASSTLFISVQMSDVVTQERLGAIFDAIASPEQIEIDDSLVNRGSMGTSSVYYMGWNGALNSITGDTKFNIPKNLQFGVHTETFVGDIEIILTDLSNPDGYTAFTKSIIDEEHHRILKSTITIYDVNRINLEDLRTLTRHELGHSLGLAHSNTPEDLMYPIISTGYPYISDCVISAITALYDGKQQSHVVCEK